MNEKAYGLGWRHVITVLAFWGFFCTYILRVNLSVALVAMVNHTAVNDNQYYKHNMLLKIPNERMKCFNNDAIGNQTNHQQNDGKFVWDEELQGLILGAFYYGYIITQIPAGLYASKHGGKWIFVIGTFVTSILTLLTPLAAEASPYWLMAVRILEGVADGVTWPSMHAMFSRWAPPLERSVLPGLAYSGSYIGVVAAFITAGYLSASEFMGGWPCVFYISGLIGCIWSIFWIILASDGPENHPYISVEEKAYIITSQKSEGKRLCPSICDLPWRSMAFSLPLWALVFSHFSSNWVFYTLLTQLPAYLKNILGFDITKNGLISSVPYLFLGIAQISTGVLADRIRNSFNIKTVVVRKVFDCLGHFIPGLCLVLVSLFVSCDSTLAILLLTIAVASSGLSGAGWMVNHLDIAPRYSGLLFGISNTVATLPGIAGPYIVGLVTKGNQTPEAWSICFYIAAVVSFSSVIIFAAFASGHVQDWAMGGMDIVDEEHVHLNGYVKEDDIRRSLLDIAILE